ncbi:MAG: hypothetical protein IMZ46_03170 [Acidobacteria bacterium]|nr:hypothetical protein [Acidobacteriota bacterium]
MRTRVTLVVLAFGSLLAVPLGCDKMEKAVQNSLGKGELAVSISVPQTVQAGQQVTGVIHVKNNSDKTISDIKILWNYSFTNTVQEGDRKLNIPPLDPGKTFDCEFKFAAPQGDQTIWGKAKWGDQFAGCSHVLKVR